MVCADVCFHKTFVAKQIQQVIESLYQVLLHANKNTVSSFSRMMILSLLQGTGALWKGWGTSCVAQGIVILTEVGISELMHLPR